MSTFMRSIRARSSRRGLYLTGRPLTALVYDDAIVLVLVPHRRAVLAGLGAFGGAAAGMKRERELRRVDVEARMLPPPDIGDGRRNVEIINLAAVRAARLSRGASGRWLELDLDDRTTKIGWTPAALSDDDAVALFTEVLSVRLTESLSASTATLGA
jgi:hypothetical protein